MAGLIDYCESGADHDSEPFQFSLKHTNYVLGYGRDVAPPKGQCKQQFLRAGLEDLSAKLLGGFQKQLPDRQRKPARHKKVVTLGTASEGDAHMMNAAGCHISQAKFCFPKI